MIKILLLITIAISFNACGQKDPEIKDPCPDNLCLFPKMPTFKEPEARGFTKDSVREEDGGRISLIKTEFDRVLLNNKKLRKICRDYAYVNVETNKEYYDKEN